MKKRIIALVVALTALVAGGLLAFSGNASAVPNSTFVSGPIGYPYSATGFDVQASGLLNIPKLTDANCPVPGTSAAPSATLASSWLLKVSLLKSSCAVGVDAASSSATIASVSLLGGAIKITAVDSACIAVANVATVGSTYGTLITNFNYSKNGTGGITIPGIASVIVDSRSVYGSGASTVALTVTLLPNFLDGHHIAAQTLEIGGCSIAAAS